MHDIPLTAKATLLCSSGCVLGESPLWHPGRKCCYWTDIEHGLLYEYNWHLGTTRSWQFSERLALVVQGKDGQLILALGTSLARFDPETEQLKWLLNVEPSPSANRCNDGACDSYGRLWIGTMELHHKSGAGTVYCIDADLNSREKIANTSISNGISWSLDKKRLYYIDSPTQLVQSYIFHEESGDILFEKNIVHVPVEIGTPDGMAIDEEGMLWIAHWGGFGVYRWNPANGRVTGRIELPVPQVTSCAFVGENLDSLLITTAKENLPQAQLAQFPESGHVFLAKPGVRGVLPYKCAF